ncbi:MAG: carboxypeptidase-like regulatory domain-containing protein [Ignavibacteriaceae bacterium]
MENKTKTVQKLTWVYISGAAFLISILLAVLLIIFSGKLSSYGITKSFYYIILIPIGLCAAAFLFGAMHSHAKYVGKNSYGQLELTGPVVIFCLVIAGGFYLAKPDSSFLLTVRVQAENNKTINKGTVTADFGSQRLKREIGENGEVLFAEVSSQFIGKKINLNAEVEGYKIKNETVQTIPDDKIIYLDLEKRKDSTLVRGTVIDSAGNPISDVFIDFESGLASTSSDNTGRFNLTIPEPVGASVLLIASKNGKVGYKEYVTIPERNSLIINFK